TIAVLILEKSVQKYFGYKSLGLSIISAFLIGLLIIPLRNSIQKLIDIAVLKGSPIQISNENALLRQELTNADKLRSVAILASSLAHEIKNPVTTINTFADYLPSKQNDPEFLNKCRNTLLSETSRIQNLLSQLLSFAKPSPPVFILVNPTSLIDEVLLLLEHKCRKGNITLTRGYTTKEEILADPNQLKQALINILFNAIEAMPNGGKLQISTSCEETTYTIAIKDTGIGIKPESLNKIFEPFFTSKNNGVGLGLAITQEIIAHHLGKISVKSTVGTGTHFFIALPKESQGKNHAS
ncbi:MAG: hypothetical protein JNN05_02860, partial [Candidatus Omnitrophica bacterium]|nr:hypothetical protein [Candidatus Omnitrophota bacterium]